MVLSMAWMTSKKSKTQTINLSSRIIEKLEQSSQMMLESIAMVEQRIKQVDLKISEFKKKEAEDKIAAKVDDPAIIGKVVSFAWMLNRDEQQDQGGTAQEKGDQVVDRESEGEIRREYPWDFKH